MWAGGYYLLGSGKIFIFASSGCPEHSTLGDTKSSINVRVRVGVRVGVGFTFSSLSNVFLLYSVITI